jgi:hypothetical protein
MFMLGKPFMPRIHPFMLIFMFKEGKSSCEEIVHAFIYVQGEKTFMPIIRFFFILNSRRETVHLGNPFMLC